MLINEKMQIEEYFYPFSEQHNPIFQSIIYNEKKIAYGKCESEMTEWNIHLRCRELNEFCRGIVNKTEDNFVRPGYNGNLPYRLGCINTWGLICNKGNYVEEHNHDPSQFSFVYYINAPEGSSPLVFSSSGYQVKPQAGKIVIFHSSLLHHVPVNNCDNRYSFVGIIGDYRK